MRTTRVVTDSRLPAYAQLRDELATRIASGEWKPDEAIPSENRLAAEYQLSVGTVRKAVEQLVVEGLLERRRGSGTFLRRPAFQASLFRFFQVRGAEGEPTSIPASRLLARLRVRAPKSVAAALGAEDVIRIVRIRSLSDAPVLAEEIFIPTALFPGFEGLAEAEFGPLLYPLYAERFGVFITRAVDELSFSVADQKRARHLGIAEGDPVAVIERTAFDLESRPVEWRRAYGSAHQFRYRTEIR